MDFDLPKSFELLGETITVLRDENLFYEEDCYGVSLISANLIKVQKPTEGVPLNADQVLSTFNHELVHFILKKMDREKLSNNEKFVELFAQMLSQFQKTAKFK